MSLTALERGGTECPGHKGAPGQGWLGAGRPDWDEFPGIILMGPGHGAVVSFLYLAGVI
jgi:hypothetical protein